MPVERIVILLRMNPVKNRQLKDVLKFVGCPVAVVTAVGNDATLEGSVRIFRVLQLSW